MDDIIWIEDERNARPTVVDSRRPQFGVTSVGPLGGHRPVGRAPVVIYPNAPVTPGYTPYAPVPVYNPAHPPAQSPAIGQPMYPGMTPGSRLAQLATPALIEGAAKVLASFLPVLPAPAPTGDVEDDIANGFTYQAALAAHAKRDEQIRTLGWLASKLLG